MPARGGRPLAVDVGSFAKWAWQPRSVWRKVRTAEKDVARGIDAGSRPRQVDAKQALVALDDPPSDYDRVDIRSVGAALRLSTEHVSRER
jgi:hypothetical protein